MTKREKIALLSVCAIMLAWMSHTLCHKEDMDDEI